MGFPKPWGGDSEIATHPDVEFLNNPNFEVARSRWIEKIV